MSAKQDVEELSTPINESQGVAPEAPIPDDDSSEGAGGEQAPPAETPPTAIAVEKELSAEPPCGPRCQQAEKREQADLVAQQRMANSTRDVVTVTQWQLYVGAAGIALLIVTVALTFRATNAAVDANRIARESAERELRAYLFLESATLIAPEDKSLPWSGAIHIKNFGNTPAYKTKIRLGVIIPDDPPKSPDFPEIEYHDNPGDCPPGQFFVVPISLKNEETGQFWAPFSGKPPIFIYGRFDYEDAFGKPRLTKFRVKSSNAMDFETCKDGNESS